MKAPRVTAIQRFRLFAIEMFMLSMAVALLVFGGRSCLAQGTLATANYRDSGANVETNSVYDYAPSVMLDRHIVTVGGSTTDYNYKMWWCGAQGGDAYPGDTVFYAESTSLDGPFTARQAVFGGTGNTSDFDGTHTCDPSVLRVNGTYYLYYGGLSQAGAETEIGVATSPDGINWARQNGGAAIVVPANITNTGAGTYGAGEPSVVYLNGYFYMIYDDSTGADNATGGPASYVIRSRGYTFQTGVDELTSTGFQPQTSTNHTTYALIKVSGVDWQYIDSLQSFALAENHMSDETLVHFFSTDLMSVTYNDVAITDTWKNGPGIVSRPDHHAVAPQGSACGTTPFDIFTATSLNTNGSPDNIQHFGLDLLQSPTVLCTDSSMVGLVPAIFEGYAIQDYGQPLALVVQGQLLKSQLSAPIKDLTHNFIVVTDDVYDNIPIGGSLKSCEAPTSPGVVYGATTPARRPGAFLIGNDLWTAGSLQLVQDDDCTITYIDSGTWDSYSHGPTLYTVQP